ncbi:hypothetical protein EWM64_g2263 [Hericium alpestre]|uniref:NADH:flavin oxidoreductase/NADH oxidase N-terminal domain-containing protein n=1 Tax=Hericium alpestre TaxID=135208 RepID=A0A4Z0A5Y3_9AGAM|nr:hypothetical protein EWM64_g2263 [Hericium alpestre]
MSASKLFQPFQLGDITLRNRVVMAPLTQYRANDEHVHGDLAAEYYTQRAGRYAHVPGIWTDTQIAGWKKVTDAVHAKGSFIYLQLWALGHAANRDVLRREYNDPHQFLQDVSNNWADEYGGSIENRARFSLEVIEAVTKAVSQKHVGIRFSPWGTFQAIKTADEKNELFVFGRSFISNPDLPLRLKEDIPFTPYSRHTFYTPENPIGYTDYPLALRN